MAKINVQNTEITIVSHNDDDYISLTDMAIGIFSKVYNKTWHAMSRHQGLSDRMTS